MEAKKSNNGEESYHAEMAENPATTDADWSRESAIPAADYSPSRCVDAASQVE